jgi:hypothetical protein
MKTLKTTPIDLSNGWKLNVGVRTRMLSEQPSPARPVHLPSRSKRGAISPPGSRALRRYLEDANLPILKWPKKILKGPACA